MDRKERRRFIFLALLAAMCALCYLYTLYDAGQLCREYCGLRCEETGGEYRTSSYFVPFGCGCACRRSIYTSAINIINISDYPP